MLLKITYDPAKDAKNRAEREGLSLGEAAHLEWETALVRLDPKPHDEPRMQALGYIGNRLHVCIYVDRPHDAPTERRVISLRKANKREVSRYAET